jgi:hypothetical protein
MATLLSCVDSSSSARAALGAHLRQQFAARGWKPGEEVNLAMRWIVPKLRVRPAAHNLHYALSLLRAAARHELPGRGGKPADIYRPLRAKCAKFVADRWGNGRIANVLRGLADRAGDNCPIAIVDGDLAPVHAGNGFWHRWRGKWKSAPGSYQASTREIQVGLDWIAQRISLLTTVVRGRAIDLAKIGPEGEDDRIQIREPRAIYGTCVAALIANRPGKDGVRWWDASITVQVVVRDTTTGQRHCITVPPSFARPLERGESEADRIRAAVAWTFGLSAKEYSPSVEA